MDILFVVPYTPTLIRVRPYNLIRFLARHGHRITLATLWENPSEYQTLVEWQAQGIEVIAAPLTRAQKVWNSLQTLPTRTPLQATYCWQPNLKSQISNLKSQFDVAHVEHLRGAQYAPHLESQFSAQPASARNLKSQIPVVWDSVDCITYLFEQAARQSQSLSSKLITRLELGRTRRYEGWLVGQFDKVLVTSETDKAVLGQLSNSMSKTPKLQSEIAVLPNGVDLEYFTPNPKACQPDTLVFSGKMSYHANIAAALYLVSEVMPLVWAQRPDVRLVIAGSRPPSAVQKLSRDYPAQIEVTGYVPDLRLPLLQASVAVAPLLYGAGIQNKVLEAMACGTPVVASPLAISALSHVQPGTDCLVADSPQAFAEEILGLLGDHTLQERLSAAGRHYVESYHNWDSIAAQLEAIYLQSIRDVQRANG